MYSTPKNNRLQVVIIRGKTAVYYNHIICINSNLRGRLIKHRWKGSLTPDKELTVCEKVEKQRTSEGVTVNESRLIGHLPHDRNAA